MDQYERFTKQAQDAAARCYEVAQQYKDNVVGTDHFFLALLEQPDSAIIKGLTKLNIDSAVIRDELNHLLHSKWRLPFRGKQIFITPEMKIIVEKSIEEANQSQKQYVSTKHIFLAIIAELNTPVSKIISNHGITRERVENVIEEDISNEGQSQS